MEEQFLNLTEKNLDREHLCCIIRSKKPHPGVEAKWAWLREGHVFRKLDAKGVVFIEYAPLETAWVPVEGDKLPLYLLPVGQRGVQRQGLRQTSDRVLSGRRQGQREVRCMYVGGGKAKGLALRPGLRGKVWI